MSESPTQEAEVLGSASKVCVICFDNVRFFMIFEPFPL